MKVKKYTVVRIVLMMLNCRDMEEKLKLLWEIAKDVYAEEDDNGIDTFEDFKKKLDEGKTLIVNISDEMYMTLIKRDDSDIDVTKHEVYCRNYVKTEYKLSELNI